MNYSLFKQLIWLVVILMTIGRCMSGLANTPQINAPLLEKKLADLESFSDGRIGLSALNTADNRRFQYRASERFPLCSTAKLMTVSAILRQSMADSHLLQQKIIYNKEDLVTYSPITEKQIVDGMKVCDLCAAAMEKSDNTAMNLLTKKLGGTGAVTLFARSIDDNTFRLDRIEPELNSAIPGDLRDTTTPEAMEKSLYQLCLGDALALPQRKQLQKWLKSCSTGDSRIRAGVPKDWIVGDKTGTGDYGTTNDVAIIWPPNRSPIVVAIYFTQNKKDANPKNDVIESVTRILINGLYADGEFRTESYK